MVSVETAEGEPSRQTLDKFKSEDLQDQGKSETIGKTSRVTA